MNRREFLKTTAIAAVATTTGSHVSSEKYGGGHISYYNGYGIGVYSQCPEYFIMKTDDGWIYIENNCDQNLLVDDGFRTAIIRPKQVVRKYCQKWDVGKIDVSLIKDA